MWYAVRLDTHNETYCTFPRTDFIRGEVFGPPTTERAFARSGFTSRGARGGGMDINHTLPCVLLNVSEAELPPKICLLGR